MSEQFTIGQSLTPEQVRNLPDGAKVAFTWKTETDIFTAPIGDNEEIGTMNILRMHLLSQPMYDSATLVFLPPAPSEPSPGEGYRWVEIGERLITGDQRESSRGAGDWFADNLPGVSCQDVHCYRRRIEPQAEPSKPERQASEIEKEAARMYEASHAASVESWCEKVGSCDSLFTWHDELTRRMGEYKEAYDYAKSIGAIE